MEDDFNIDADYIRRLSVKYKDVDHPLFMSELPKNIEENEDLVALYNLMLCDENDLSLARNYKEVGNDYYKDGVKYYEDAIISYSKGIKVLNNYLVSATSSKLSNKSTENGTTNGATNGTEAPLRENKKEKVQEHHREALSLNTPKGKEGGDLCEMDVRNLLCDLYCNRAIIHYKKKRYVQCLDDCKLSFSFNEKKYKSVYYSILCTQKLELFNEAYKYIVLFDNIIQDENVKCSLNIKEYERIKNEIIQKYTHLLNEKKRKEEERKLLVEMEKNNINHIQNILKKRDIKILNNVYNDNNNIIPVFYIDKSMFIHFTIFLIYFETNIIDTILDVSENNCLMDYYNIVKKNKNNLFLFSYLEFPNDIFYIISCSSYISDIINKIKIISPILSVHIIENEEANKQFQLNKNIHSVKT
ncbi:conserved Plasmodium protein, unknown function [Plasmodium malariae]|uniref:Tetratricopeptide repeat protein n=1 Tax=Plasmodium malariae TaxID=5858 RepID=A0A1A8VZT0_PLAMA|nr:conserved Plasmodium protein, unknown function [Plasmodium malariae]SBS85204.1 conserved Plasmodium protein, unknown function [Plasmodium malariae]SCN12617.1 conserved Plasmodium protein, unknown function [Plasmodium malariae]